MRRLLIAGGLVAALAACGPRHMPLPDPDKPKPGPEQVSPITLSAAETAAVRGYVRGMLKDPDSARFGKMVAGRSASGEALVCLDVNAKNSFGGYTGMLPYMVAMRGRDLRLISYARDGELARYVYGFCAERGLRFPA